jgi:cobalamin biosynthesis protein CobW
MESPMTTPANRQKIPATIVTGFLGAGKTSLIRHLLEESGGRRIALIINEFGDQGVDRDLIQGCGIPSCREEDMIELANGCICCTVADDFVPTMQKLLDRPERPDHIVIETSGLALPKPLVKAFTWPAVRNAVTVDGVVAVVDAEATAAGLFASDPAAVAAARAADPGLDHESPLEELFEEQVGCADLVVLNKCDRVDAAGKARARDAVGAHLRPGVHIVEASHGALDPFVLLGQGAAAEDDLESRHSHHDDGGEHDHDDFESFVVSLPPLARPAEIEARIRAVAGAHEVLRVKGFAVVEGKPMRLAVQAVGARVASYFDRPWAPGEAPLGALVVIGLAGLDRAAISARLAGNTAEVAA